MTGTASGTQLYILYHETTTSALASYVTSLTSTGYWALQDVATAICGTTEVTVQETVGATSSCVYPTTAVGTPCPALSSTYLLSGLGTRSSSVAAISGAPVTITIKMELSVASSTAVARLHMVPDISFATAYSTSLFSAGFSYPYASVEL